MFELESLLLRHITLAMEGGMVQIFVASFSAEENNICSLPHVERLPLETCRAVAASSGNVPLFLRCALLLPTTTHAAPLQNS